MVRSINESQSSLLPKQYLLLSPGKRTCETVGCCLTSTVNTATTGSLYLNIRDAIERNTAPITHKQNVSGFILHLQVLPWYLIQAEVTRM